MCSKNPCRCGVPIFCYDELNSQARSCYMLIKLLDIDVELRSTCLSNGKRLSDTDRMNNPSGTAPTLIDGNLVLSDGHTILMYLCDQYACIYWPHLWPCDYLLSLQVLNMLFYEAGVIYRLQSHMLTEILLRKYSNVDLTYHVEKVTECYIMLDNILEGRTFIVGNCLTIADFSLVTTVADLDLMFTIDREQCPNLYRWIANLKNMECYKNNLEGLEKQRQLLEIVGEFPFPSPLTMGGTAYRCSSIHPNEESDKAQLNADNRDWPRATRNSLQDNVKSVITLHNVKELENSASEEKKPLKKNKDRQKTSRTKTKNNDESPPAMRSDPSRMSISANGNISKKAQQNPLLTDKRISKSVNPELQHVSEEPLDNSNSGGEDDDAVDDNAKDMQCSCLEKLEKPTDICNKCDYVKQFIDQFYCKHMDPLEKQEDFIRNYGNNLIYSQNQTQDDEVECMELECVLDSAGNKCCILKTGKLPAQQFFQHDKQCPCCAASTQTLFRSHDCRCSYEQGELREFKSCLCMESDSECDPRCPCFQRKETGNCCEPNSNVGRKPKPLAKACKCTEEMDNANCDNDSQGDDNCNCGDEQNDKRAEDMLLSCSCDDDEGNDNENQAFCDEDNESLSDCDRDNDPISDCGEDQTHTYCNNDIETDRNECLDNDNSDGDQSQDNTIVNENDSHDSVSCHCLNTIDAYKDSNDNGNSHRCSDSSANSNENEFNLQNNGIEDKTCRCCRCSSDGNQNDSKEELEKTEDLSSTEESEEHSAKLKSSCNEVVCEGCRKTLDVETADGEVHKTEITFVKCCELATDEKELTHPRTSCKTDARKSLTKKSICKSKTPATTCNKRQSKPKKCACGPAVDDTSLEEMPQSEIQERGTLRGGLLNEKRRRSTRPMECGKTKSANLSTNCKCGSVRGKARTSNIHDRNSTQSNSEVLEKENSSIAEQTEIPKDSPRTPTAKSAKQLSKSVITKEDNKVNVLKKRNDSLKPETDMKSAKVTAKINGREKSIGTGNATKRKSESDDQKTEESFVTNMDTVKNKTTPNTPKITKSMKDRSVTETEATAGTIRKSANYKTGQLDNNSRNAAKSKDNKTESLDIKKPTSGEKRAGNLRASQTAAKRNGDPEINADKIRELEEPRATVPESTNPKTDNVNTRKSAEQLFLITCTKQPRADECSSATADCDDKSIPISCKISCQISEFKRVTDDGGAKSDGKISDPSTNCQCSSKDDSSEDQKRLNSSSTSKQNTPNKKSSNTNRNSMVNTKETDQKLPRLRDISRDRKSYTEEYCCRERENSLDPQENCYEEVTIITKHYNCEDNNMDRPEILSTKCCRKSRIPRPRVYKVQQDCCTESIESDDYQ